MTSTHLCFYYSLHYCLKFLKTESLSVMNQEMRELNAIEPIIILLLRVI